jgi:DNA-binding PucR family transcriptional regulator
MHHSSVAARIARAEQILGWDLGTPHGMLRARIATQARQLIKNVSLE